MPRKILIATSTRADWGLLSPVARMLADMAGIEVKVMATNMHLDPVRGNTLDEIRGDGFEPVVAYMPIGYATGADAARAMADGARSAADVIEGESPDIVVVLGDRFEILGIAAVANVMRVPVVHISGGEVTEGAFDDNFRHAVTKLSALHLVSTADYRRRVIQLGEEPDRVIDTGALGVANVMEDTGLTVGELEADIDFHFFPVSLLVTLHPATLSDIPARESVSHLLAALDRFPDINLLFTYPNNDPEGEEIIRAIDAYAAADRAGRVRVVPSLGRRRYHTALRGVSAVVGNSSSGIMEVPSAGIPTVDIGIRQRGRLSPASVIHCDDSADAIAAAIARALETDCSGMANPYYKPDTVKLIAGAIAYTPMKLLRRPKRFMTCHDTAFIIPARGGSKSIPGKNIKPLCGKPLIAYSIESALALAPQSRVIVTTDSDDIAACARKYGVDNPYMRPESLASDTAGSREVMLDAMDEAARRGVDFDCVVLLQPTSPLRTVADIQAALDAYAPSVDMAVTVASASCNPYYDCFETGADGFLRVSKGEGLLTRRQQAPPAWQYNGAVYVINPGSLRRYAMGAFPKRVGVEMPRERSIDIDSPTDWIVAETLMGNRRGG